MSSLDNIVTRLGQATAQAEEATAAYKGAIMNVGYKLYRAFEASVTLTQVNEAVQFSAGGIFYRWDGVFPQGGLVIPQNTPEPSPDQTGAGKYIAVLDLEMRDILSSQSRQAIKRSYKSAGFNLVSGSFELGGTLSKASDVLLYSSTGVAYSWNGDLPKTVLPSSSPSSDPLFINRSDVVVSDVLASKTGATQIGTQSGLTVESELASLKSISSDNTEQISQVRDTVAMTNHNGNLSGGQLLKLKQALASPLSQTIGLAFIGDSITWGLGASASGPSDPRTGQLSDQRNTRSAKSFANTVREWLAREYFPGAAMDVGIWPGSSGGDARFAYSAKNSTLIALNDPTMTFTGTWVDGYDSSATVGTYKTANPNISGAGEYSLTFKMTGLFFDLVFAAYTKGAKYKVYVDGSQLGGEYPTDNTVLGVPVQFGYKRRHYVGGQNREVTVKIELINDYPNYYVFRMEAIEISRQFRVINQGIIGLSSKQVVDRVIPTGIEDTVNFAFVQIGTNDRNMPYYLGQPSNVATLRKNIYDIVSALTAKKVNVVLMCANNTTDTPLYYGMAEVRGAISSVAKELKVDFIDNYAATNTARNLDALLVDKLHPNDAGYAVMARNIINCIVSA